MPRVDVRLTINASVDEVWRAVNDIESYSEFMENVQTVSVVSEDGHERVSAWSVLLKGSVLDWTEREIVHDSERCIVFDQVDGDLDRFSGYWQLRQTTDRRGCQADVEFEIGIPLLADMLNPVAARAVRDKSETMLREIERKVATTP